ncbi:unnamed protein product [Sphagnum troendelagicum]|uniref:Secreted protein n=1 Tax=Sphagnum troendelagicum TaxID=128251 RepID=A0ABP0UGJ5_9BRYO
MRNCPSWMKTAAGGRTGILLLVDGTAGLWMPRLPCADESCCTDVKLPFADEKSYSWMPNCPSWMKNAGGGRTGILSLVDGTAGLWMPRLPCADESCCMDVKLPFVDDRSYSWMPKCPSWMKKAARRRKLLSRDKETGAERNL